MGGWISYVYHAWDDIMDSLCLFTFIIVAAPVHLSRDNTSFVEVYRLPKLRIQNYFELFHLILTFLCLVLAPRQFLV